MPFGEHKGRALADLMTTKAGRGYLVWLGTLSDLYGRTADAVHIVLEEMQIPRPRYTPLEEVFLEDEA